MKIKKQDLTLPLTVQLEVTNSCNHKCPHCYIINNSIQYSNNREENKAFQIAEKLVKNKVLNVIVTGGEPLTKPKLTQKVISYLKSNGVQTSLNTNLTLINDEIISFLKDVSIDSILTSCPSADADLYQKMVGVDKFDQFINNLAKINYAQLKNTVNMVITKNNINDIYNTARALKDVGCESFAATPMGFNVNNPQKASFLDKTEIKRVIEELIRIQDDFKMNIDIAEALPKCVIPEDILDKKYSFLNRTCSAGKTVAAISCTGDVRPCAHNLTAYGNIFSDDLHTIWNKMANWRANKYIPQRCKNCSWLNKCKGGCRTNAKVHFGDWDSEDPWMVGPLTKKNVVNTVKIHEDIKFCVNQNLVFREETKSAYIIQISKQHLYVNEYLFNFIMDLKSYDRIGLNDISRLYSVDVNDDSFKKTIKYLVAKGFLEII